VSPSPVVGDFQEQRTEFDKPCVLPILEFVRSRLLVVQMTSIRVDSRMNGAHKPCYTGTALTLTTSAPKLQPWREPRGQLNRKIQRGRRDTENPPGAARRESRATSEARAPPCDDSPSATKSTLPATWSMAGAEPQCMHCFPGRRRRDSLVHSHGCRRAKQLSAEPVRNMPYSSSLSQTPIGRLGCP